MNKLPITGGFLWVVAVAATVALLIGGHRAGAVHCNPIELPGLEDGVSYCNPSELIAPCGFAYLFNLPPSYGCCGKLKEQKPCYCQYIKDPSLKPYIFSDSGRRIARACNIIIPTCAA
ncbi:non-specific lipid-transfer protein 2P-like [Momordica charantia]|uniref:Non-specific lipid-transfer protein 2P-like n=1 Tax=Momordica charantia TaxID=3673 RepID=A0A6J1CPW9_MOMCH|nr:non-specific lipid-transfer protein 2P-like [Momordica charantia]